MNLRKKLDQLTERTRKTLKDNPAAEKTAADLVEKLKKIAGNETPPETKRHPSVAKNDQEPHMEKPSIGLPKVPPIPIAVSEDQLNQLARKAILDDKNIESLRIQCSHDGLTIAGTLRLSGLPLSFKTRLLLEKCEIGPKRKVVTLRRLDDVVLGGEGMLGSFMAHVIKIIICGLFGVDLAAISLNRIKGLSVKKDIITADLEALGAIDAILTGVRAKIRPALQLLPGGPLVRRALEAILDLGGPLLLNKIQIENVAVTNTGIRAEIELVGLKQTKPERRKK